MDAGIATGQTDADPDNAKGWLDWPFVRNGTANEALTIPERGFDKIIRVSYWINAVNPIGATETVVQDLHYSASVGYGPGTNGQFLRQIKVGAFARPFQLVAFADGPYAAGSVTPSSASPTAGSDTAAPARAACPTPPLPMGTWRLLAARSSRGPWAGPTRWRRSGRRT